jgi:Flp pilus assembly protein TadG
MTVATFFLLVLLVGIVDFGRAFYTYIVLTNSAREGARYGSRLSHDEAGILKATKSEAAAGGVVLEDANIDIDPNPVREDDDDFGDGEPKTAEPGDPIAVTVSYDVGTILGSIIGFDSVPMQARTEMAVFWKKDE